MMTDRIKRLHDAFLKNFEDVSPYELKTIDPGIFGVIENLLYSIGYKRIPEIDYPYDTRPNHSGTLIHISGSIYFSGFAPLCFGPEHSKANHAYIMILLDEHPKDSSEEFITGGHKACIAAMDEYGTVMGLLGEEAKVGGIVYRPSVPNHPDICYPNKVSDIQAALENMCASFPITANFLGYQKEIELLSKFMFDSSRTYMMTEIVKIREL
ncbi:MAG: hypothetical protein NDI94_00985 [Candidatus Woesearchaeota archaeon]|nr:hypothetical protein [Candidatus Woesearchaeota archaeon]